ncbi:unnamed protein product [Ixodes hexagonus]
MRSQDPQVEDLETFYRQRVFLPILGSIIEDLSSRFPEETLSVYDLNVCVPHTLVTDVIEPNDPRVERLTDRYHRILDPNNRTPMAKTLGYELIMWKAKWLRQNGDIPAPSTATESLDACDGDLYPNVRTLLQILASLPVSVASAERTFSTLRRLKTWLRAKMTEERLTGLALLNIHRDIHVDSSRVTDRFASARKRRTDFLL